MGSFINYLAYKKLKLLAKQPVDLTKDGVLTARRIKTFQAYSFPYKLFYATERVTEEVLEALRQLAEESCAVEKMHQMQNGEVINYIENYPCDNRSVLHTALRDFFDEPKESKKAKEAASLALAECEKLKVFLQKYHHRFNHVISIAIGGSSLGPQALYLALEPYLLPDKKVSFISNVDPDDVAGVLNHIDLEKALVVVVSKSGTTLETKTNESFVNHFFEEKGLDPKKHFVAITSKGSPMDDPSRYLEVFHIWDYIGGRFSASSMVGGVILSFAYGFEVYWEFLKGCHAMDRAALKKDVDNNLPLLAALIGIWNRNFLDLKTFTVVPYSFALRRFPAHIQQVDMESNGKRIDQKGQAVNFETGPIVFGEPGTDAQHSFYQLLHQGTTISALELIGFKKSQRDKDFLFEGTLSQQKLLANCFAQLIAFAKGRQSDNPNRVFLGNRPSHLLLAEALTPFSLGALFAFYEHKVAFQGFIWGINSFDQEGVMLGKILANQILKDIQDHTRKNSLGATFLEEMENL